MEDFCERCGEFGAGKSLWMFQQEWLPRKEFYCRRCLRIMRIYAAIGFSLLGTMVASAFVAAWWAGAFR